MVQRGDPAAGLHGILHRCGAIAEIRRGRVDVRDVVGDSPEAGRAVARVSRRTDDLDDDLSGTEEDLPDRVTAELRLPFPTRFDAERGQRSNRSIEVG